ncbi:MAG TPA: magnesium transporter [Gemmataceae bacterium]|nr:magnesium transporter [Gemmataceae bacterium]
MSEVVKPDPTILHHLEEPVTRHMRRDFVRLHVKQTIGEALASIRQNPPKERVIYFYVVDDDDRLQGVVPTRRLLLNPPETLVADVMVREVISIPMRATVLEACEFFTLYRLLAFPVVDEDRHVVGVVDVELYTTELSELDRSERNDYLFQLIGVHLAEAQLASPVASFRSRFPWLLCNIAGGVLAAFLSGVFEKELQKAVALALFIPVVLALAESVSIQSVSLSLQLLFGQQPTLKTLLPKLRKELLVGLLLGLASGTLVGLVAILWLGQFQVMLCVLGGIAGGVTGAAVIGVAMPNVLRILQRDPQVAAGPIALASTDMVTLLIYFNLARWLLG